MDPSSPVSFIPKKTLETSSKRGRGGATGLILLIAILIFVAAVVASGAAFGYQSLLKQQIASKSNSLALNEKAYDPAVIQELIRVDNRIKEARSLLDTHVAPSALFAFLSQQTLEKVQFTSFAFTLEEDGSAEIVMDGLADTFATVALQSDQFGASKVLRDVVFSGVNVDPDEEGVTFSVAATVVPSLLTFTNAMSATPVTPAAPTNGNEVAPAATSTQ